MARADSKLTAKSRRLFAAAEVGRATVYIPSIVLMELVVLEQIGRIRMPYAELREQLALRPSLRVEPLLAEDVDEARGLGAVGDPFDRLIAGTALRLGLPLITGDDVLRDLRAVRTIW